jgi:hypothetical protein
MFDTATGTRKTGRIRQTGPGDDGLAERIPGEEVALEQLI